MCSIFYVANDEVCLHMVWCNNCNTSQVPLGQRVILSLSMKSPSSDEPHFLTLTIFHFNIQICWLNGDSTPASVAYTQLHITTICRVIQISHWVGSVNIMPGKVLNAVKANIFHVYSFCSFQTDTINIGHNSSLANSSHHNCSVLHNQVSPGGKGKKEKKRVTKGTLSNDLHLAVGTTLQDCNLTRCATQHYDTIAGFIYCCSWWRYLYVWTGHRSPIVMHVWRW